MRGTSAICIQGDRGAANTRGAQVGAKRHFEHLFELPEPTAQSLFYPNERTYTNVVGKIATETDLTDAISRHGYAFYSDSGGQMLTCDLSPPGKARVICPSREEFDAFTARYTE
jgi:hypothetical protein